MAGMRIEKGKGMSEKRGIIEALRAAKTEDEITAVCSAHGLRRDEVVVGNVRINSADDRRLAGVRVLTGDLYISAEAKLDAPKLQTVGGYLSIYAEAKLDAPKLRDKSTPEARAKARALRFTTGAASVIVVGATTSAMFTPTPAHHSRASGTPSRSPARPGRTTRSFGCSSSSPSPSRKAGG